MIQAETEPIANSLKSEHADAIRANAMTALGDFIKDQSKMLLNLADQVSQGECDVAKITKDWAPAKKQAVLDEVQILLGQSHSDGAQQDERRIRA